MAVRDKYLSSFNLVNDLNASILEGSAEVECENISIEDDLFHNEGVTTARSITSLLSEWQQLDADYLVDFNRVNGTGKRTGLAVPYSFDLSQINSGCLNFEGMEHERIPPHLKNEYLTKLTKLFQKLPQEHKSGGVSMPLISADNTEKFLVHDLHLVPELRPPFERYTQTVKAEPTEALQPASNSEANQEMVTNNDIVVSVTVFGADHRLTQPQQCIEILGSQTLWQLQQAIYCVHNTPVTGDECNSSSSSSAEGNYVNSRRDKNYFFCIDGQIYAQLCRPTASGTIQGHHSSCTCNNTITSIGQDNNNSSGSGSVSGSSSSAEATAQLNTGIGNDYVPGTEPVRALMWLYRSLFGITLPSTIENTANNSTDNISEQNNICSSTILPTDQHLSVTNSSNSRDEVEQIIFISTNEPSPAAAKPKRGRPSKNSTVSATDSNQPTGTSAGSVANISAASAEVTQTKTKGKKRSSNNVHVDSTITTSTSAASTVPKGRKKAATAQSTQGTASTHHINTSPSADTNAKAESDNLARLQHPYDFHALRAAVTSSTAAIEMKCVYNMHLADMNFTLGVPYLYTHACGCEHILYFTNIRTYSHKYDHIGPTIEKQQRQQPTNTMSNGYPLETFRARHKQKRCTVCEVLPAVCVVFEDRLAETNPTLYCEHCYHMLHYSAEGHLLYDDFQVFPYIHDP